MFCANRLAIVQKKTAPQIASRSKRSTASAVQAPCHVLNSPPSVRAGGTGGIVQAAANPTSERRAKGRGANQVESPVKDKRKPGAAVPVRMAAKVHYSSWQLPAANRSCGTNSARIPYLAGLKRALWTPIPPSTIKGRTPPAGLIQRAAVAALISSISTDFIRIMMVRLLTRSASRPATVDTSASGAVNTMKASVVWVCDAVSNSEPGAIVEASWRMANRATINFQALSLNAPQNWAMSNPRRGDVVLAMNSRNVSPSL